MWKIDAHLMKCFGRIYRTLKLLDWWSESSCLLFKLFRFDVCHFFYCYYFAERFSFVGSSEIGSSNIWNDVIRIKFWMKQGVNQSNMKTVLDEPENVGWKFCSRSNFYPTQYIFMEHDFFFFFFCYFCVLLNRSNVSSNMAFLLCWMKYCIGLTRSLFR